MQPHDGMLVAALRHRGEDFLAERPDPWTGCVEVEVLEGAPHARFFAPRTEPVACFEPMAAPSTRS